MPAMLNFDTLCALWLTVVTSQQYCRYDKKFPNDQPAIKFLMFLEISSMQFEAQNSSRTYVGTQFSQEMLILIRRPGL